MSSLTRVCLLKYPGLKGKLQICPTARKSAKIHDDEAPDTHRIYPKDGKAPFTSSTCRLVNQKERTWLTQLRSLKHPHVAQFIALSIDNPLVSFVYEYAHRGTVEDIVKENRPLHSFLRCLLVKGLVQGLHFLHTNIGSHGHVHPRTCFIDENWNLKIAGFGITYYIMETGPPFDVQKHLADEEQLPPPLELFFVAPELRHAYPHVGVGTTQGDMYSASMMMYTLLNQTFPYEDHPDLDSILVQWSQPCAPTRPEFHSSVPKEWVELAWQCHHVDPHQRPTAATLLPKIEILQTSYFTATILENGGEVERAAQRVYHADSESYTRALELSLSREDAFQSIQDLTSSDARVVELKNKLDALEQYSTKEIQKRDDLLESERRRATAVETLLEKEILELRRTMLPQSIGDHCKVLTAHKRASLSNIAMANRVVDQLDSSSCHYTNVSVLVVTIVHFNSLVEIFSKTPDLMMNILKVYYDMIDAFLSSHPQVYLVERISDTCIFLSGAPDPNPTPEKDLADLALMLMKWAEQPTLEWGAHQKVKIGLKMGIHSGNITAGVVGRVPKFVVLGETINIAARIQSQSESQEIRTSFITQQLLENQGYLFERTLDLDLRAKGRLAVYKLKGKTT